MSKFFAGLIMNLWTAQSDPNNSSELFLNESDETYEEKKKFRGFNTRKYTARGSIMFVSTPTLCIFDSILFNAVVVRLYLLINDHHKYLSPL